MLSAKPSNKIKFETACNTIESNQNYKPGITNNQLFDLVIDYRGKPKYKTFFASIATAILPVDAPVSSTSSATSGRLFEVKVAANGYPDADSDVRAWFIDCNMIFVNHRGEMSLHTKDKALKHDFSSPLSHETLDELLDAPCLHLTIGTPASSYPC